MSESLESTARMLQQMNGQLAMTGKVLTDLADNAKAAAAQENVLRRTQIAQMTETVGDLVGRLQGHAEESMGSMEKAVAEITLDMSRSMSDLLTKAASVIERTSERSADGAREALDRACALASRSTEQFAALLEEEHAGMSGLAELRDALEGTIRRFTQALGLHGEAMEGLSSLAAEVNGNDSSLAGITESVAKSQEAAALLLSSSSGQIEGLQGFALEQEAAWKQIQASMTGYETMFQAVDGRAKELLKEIARHLGGYSTVTEKHFTLLATTADNFVSQAAGRLSGSIDELGEQLDDLHDAVNKMACAAQSMR